MSDNISRCTVLWMSDNISRCTVLWMSDNISRCTVLSMSDNISRCTVLSKSDNNEPSCYALKEGDLLNRWAAVSFSRKISMDELNAYFCLGVNSRLLHSKLTVVWVAPGMCNLAQLWFSLCQKILTLSIVPFYLYGPSDPPYCTWRKHA